MKKISVLSFWVLTLLFLSGCTTSTVKPTMEYAKGKKFSGTGNMVIADIEATNYTSYLFGLLPIVGGSHSRPNACQYYMWRDTVSNRKTQNMMNWYGKRVLKGDGIENFKIRRKTIGWPTLWIVSWRTVHASAQVVKNTPKKQK